MIIKRLSMKNIRSYKSIELELPKGSVLLSGDIGSGKTSILLGLQFALFGLQPGQKGASLMRAGESEAEVELEFELNEDTIVIKRGIKRSKNGSISQDSNIISVNGIEEDLSTSEAKNRVIDLLEYPKEFAKKSNLLYKYTVYTPQESMKEIIQENPDIRLDTLRHIFGIDRYKRIKENLDIFLQKIKEAVKIKEVEIREMNPIREKLGIENEKKIGLAKEVNNLNLEYSEILKKKQEQEIKIKEYETKISEKNNLNTGIIKSEAELRGKKELKSRTEREIELIKNQIKERIEFKQESLQEIERIIQTHKKNLEDLNEGLLTVSSDISVFLSRKDKAFDLKEKIIHLENCPTCFQTVSMDHKEKISKRTQYDLEEIERGLETRMLDKKRLTLSIEKEKELIIGYEKDRQDLERLKIQFQHQREIEIKLKSDVITLDRINIEIKNIEEGLNEIRNKLVKYQNIEEIYQNQKVIFDELSKKNRFIEINLAQKTKELEMVKININEIEMTLSKMENIKNDLVHIRGLQDWLEDKFLELINMTETNVLSKLRTDFSRIFQEWFSMLVSPPLSVRIDEDFTPVISNQDYEIEYDFLSGGERTAVALAYRLALNQTLNSMLSRLKTKNLIILDEPTDGFSEQQLDKMRDIFEQLNSEQLILVSHEQKIEGFVDNIIRIKKDGTSKIDAG